MVGNGFCLVKSDFIIYFMVNFFKTRKSNKIKTLIIFGCEVIFSSKFYQICAKNRQKADKINDYLIQEGFLDRFTNQNEFH